MKKIDELTPKAYFKKLSECHPEAIRTSKHNLQFNVFEDEWVIDYNKTAYLSGLFDSNFSLDEQIKIRLTLSDIVNQNSPKVSILCIQSIIRNDIKELSIHGLELLVAKSRTYSNDHLLKKNKTFMKKLAIRYPEYLDLEKYICSIKVRRSQPSIYDSEKGALTEYEFNSLSVNLNNKSEELFSNTSSNFKNNFGHFFNLRCFITLRLFHSTSRRPIQLSQLKWCDLNYENNQIMDGLTVQMTKPKQKTSLGFRTIFEEYKIPLDAKTSIDLIKYKKNYIYIFKNLCRENKINLNKEDLINLVTKSSQIFHTSAESIGTTFSYHLKSFNISSDRTTNININSTRLRHTIGSMLAKMGVSINNISNVLGNTPKAAWYYIDLLPTNRQQIDAKLNPLMIDVVNKFLGTITNKILDEKNLISASNSTSIGEANKQSTCLKCLGDRPLVCYGCENFRPLVNADHQSQLTKLQNLIVEKELNDVNEATLAPLKVTEFNIKMTIVACESSKILIGSNSDD